jgi:predicted ATPase
MPSPIGRLQRIDVQGLFGDRDHAISLDDAAPTVLTGANGTGKSTILRLANAVSSADVAALASAPFRVLELHFATIPPFVATRGDSNTLLLKWGKYEDAIAGGHWLDALPDWAAAVVLEHSDDVTDLPSLLSEAARGAGVPYSEYQHVRSILAREEVVTPTAPEWMTELGAAFPVLFVTDQRLVVESPRKVGGRLRRETSSRLAVEAASADIAQQMRRADSVYARISQQQDRRFPRDVLDAMAKSETKFTTEMISELLEEVAQRRERLHAVGLLDQEQAYGPELAEVDLEQASLEQEYARPVIATFLRATLRKLEVLEEVSGTLQVFKRFLDERFNDKSMELDRYEGVKFSLRDTGSIRPRRLSSGEQQMFVLAYEVLFRTQPGTLVIVDEPEISLHVLWQDTLIGHLQDMGQAGDLQFLLATHSPVLLGDYPELERSLD